jgi:hypothetical protein
LADADGQSGLTPIAISQLAQARALAKLLDRAVRIPGTSISFGLDALLGLIPGGGDLAGAAFSAWLIILGARMGLPGHVLARMVANVAIDTLGGTVPLIGDLFDVAWKSNSRNLALLEQFAGSTAGNAGGRLVSRTTVIAAIAVLGLLVVGGIWLAVFVVKALIALAT